MPPANILSKAVALHHDRTPDLNRPPTNIGCELLSCGCLDDAATNENGKKMFPYWGTGESSRLLATTAKGKSLHLIEISPLVPLANILSKAVAPGREGVDGLIAQGPG